MKTFFILQYHYFWLAVGFFSRIPIPSNVRYSPSFLNRANRYFSLVGWLIALILVAIYVLSIQLLSKEVSVFIIILCSIILTGAFHEDGLADMADGLGGGVTISQKLEIMKDSRVGTYGVLSLMSIILAKYVLLNELNNVVIAILIAYPLSRAFGASFIYDMTYMGSETLSKSKPMAKKQSKGELICLVSIGLMPLVLIEWPSALVLIWGLLSLRFSFKRFLMSHLGGYTGDCLGAAQQISEIFIYFVLVILGTVGGYSCFIW